MATANPTDTSGIVGDDFLSWPVSAQRAELDRLQHILDRTRECLNLDGTDDDSSFEDRAGWDQATPEPFSASTPIISGVAEDDGQGMPDLTPIAPFSAGLYSGQGHGAYGHGAPPVGFSVERHAERGFRDIARGLPPVARVSTSVTQTTSVFSYSRPLPSPSVHSRSQRRVSFAPVPWDTTSGSMDMEATSVYGGIWLPSGIPSHEGNYVPISTPGTANFPCSYQTLPPAQEVPQQSMSRSSLQGRFQGPLGRGNDFTSGPDVARQFPLLTQGNVGDSQGRYQGQYQPELQARSNDVYLQRQACAGDFHSDDGTASQMDHNLHVDARVMPSRPPYDDVTFNGPRRGFSDGVIHEPQAHGREIRLNEYMLEHEREDVSSSFPDNGVNRTRHWMHDGRPRHHDSFPLNARCSPRIPSSQRVPSSESEAYHPVEATSQRSQDGLLAGAAWRAGRPEEFRSTPSGAYSDHTWPLTRREMAGQSLHDHRLQKGFGPSIARRDAFGPSGQPILSSVGAGAVTSELVQGRHQDLGFLREDRGQSSREHPPNLGSLYSMGPYGTPLDAAEAILQGNFHDSHVPRSQFANPGSDFSTGLSQVSGTSVPQQSASLQRHGWCAFPSEPELRSQGHAAVQQTMGASIVSPPYPAYPLAANAACETGQCSDIPGSRGVRGCPGPASDPAPAPDPVSAPAPDPVPAPVPGLACGGPEPWGKPKRMPNYDGKSSWSDYLVQFEIAAEMNRWSSKQKAMELATSLVGQARGVLSDLSSLERTDFTALVRKLTLRFEPVDLIGMYQSQLRGRRRKRNESIPELVQDISKLTRMAFPSADEETRNYMSVTSFITALSNEQQELFVYQRDPKRIEEAGKAAMAFESFQADRQLQSTSYVRMQKGSSQCPAPLGDLSNLEGRIAMVEQAQANVQNIRPVTMGRTTRSGKCHYCGKPGHWQRNCFKKQRDESQSSGQSSSGAAVDPSVDSAGVTSPPVSGNSR